jgi:hypothetical protein
MKCTDSYVSRNRLTEMPQGITWRLDRMRVAEMRALADSDLLRLAGLLRHWELVCQTEMAARREARTDAN